VKMVVPDDGNAESARRNRSQEVVDNHIISGISG
jgi:hypothetical protein